MIVYDLKVKLSDKNQVKTNEIKTFFNEESIPIALNHVRENGYTVLDHSITERAANKEEREILKRFEELEKELDLM